MNLREKRLFVFECCVGMVVREIDGLIDDQLVELIVLFLSLFIVCVNQQHGVTVTHRDLWNLHFRHLCHFLRLTRGFLQITKTELL
jgi:hypothetical protein